MPVIRPASMVAALLLLASAHAGAHAFLERAEPRVGSTVKAQPAQVRLWFTERLEPAFSWVKVMDGSGEQVDRGDARVDPANTRLLTVSVPPLPPGTYRVIWRVLSVDTHVTEGEFIFRVAP
jgi:hypothetical protein